MTVRVHKVEPSLGPTNAGMSTNFTPTAFNFRATPSVAGYGRGGSRSRSLPPSGARDNESCTHPLVFRFPPQSTSQHCGRAETTRPNCAGEHSFGRETSISCVNSSRNNWKSKFDPGAIIYDISMIYNLKDVHFERGMKPLAVVLLPPGSKPHGAVEK